MGERILRVIGMYLRMFMLFVKVLNGLGESRRAMLTATATINDRLSEKAFVPHPKRG